MANTIILRSIFISYIALITASLITSIPKSEGFSVDLIHRDSPKSPSYDPSLSLHQRLTNAVHRSYDRAHRFFNATRWISTHTPQTNIVNHLGEYLVQYAIGTPPFPSLGVFDTASDVTWTQCKPCKNCFAQNLPIFAPHKYSSTYKTIPCNHPRCTAFRQTTCSKTPRKTCLYSESYAGGSFSEGELAVDTLTLSTCRGKTVSIPYVKFGCGFRNGVPSGGGGESGVVGLGGGPSSLVRQLGRWTRGKFSYCLVSVTDQSNSSKLNFGVNARVSGRGVVSTPMAWKEPVTFYYLTMEGISIGNQRLRFSDDDDEKKPKPKGKAEEEGNIVIDSGTTLTLLPFGLYGRMVEVMKSSIKVERVADPQGMLELCYRLKSGDVMNMPAVTVHFKGADVRLTEDNVFARMSDVMVCLAAMPVEGRDAIYGNLWQVNFLVGYDLVKRTVSFKAADCGQ
ncbi:hypothetical protein ACP275_02G141900 [Erythranthe tilingii]